MGKYQNRLGSIILGGNWSMRKKNSELKTLLERVGHRQAILSWKLYCYCRCIMNDAPTIIMGYGSHDCYIRFLIVIVKLILFVPFERFHQRVHQLCKFCLLQWKKELCWNQVSNKWASLNWTTPCKAYLKHPTGKKKKEIWHGHESYRQRFRMGLKNWISRVDISG